MSERRGRNPGLILHSEGFEAIIAAQGSLKKDVAAAAGITPSTISGLLAHRGGASAPLAKRIAEALGVEPSALFPELVGWSLVLPGRRAIRGD